MGAPRPFRDILEVSPSLGVSVASFSYCDILVFGTVLWLMEMQLLKNQGGSQAGVEKVDRTSSSIFTG